MLKIFARDPKTGVKTLVDEVPVGQLQQAIREASKFGIPSFSV